MEDRRDPHLLSHKSRCAGLLFRHGRNVNLAAEFSQEIRMMRERDYDFAPLFREASSVFFLGEALKRWHMVRLSTFGLARLNNKSRTIARHCCLSHQAEKMESSPNGWRKAFLIPWMTGGDPMSRPQAIQSIITSVWETQLASFSTEKRSSDICSVLCWVSIWFDCHRHLCRGLSHAHSGRQRSLWLCLLEAMAELLPHLPASVQAVQMQGQSLCSTAAPGGGSWSIAGIKADLNTSCELSASILGSQWKWKSRTL